MYMLKICRKKFCVKFEKKKKKSYSLEHLLLMHI